VLALRTSATDTDEPSRIVTGDSPSSLLFGDSHIELDARTAVATAREGGHPTVLLERGAAWFTVAPRKERPAFVVRAGDALVRVVGTRFRVARSEEHIAVAVEHGVVDVQFRGRVVPVGAGQRWSSESPGAASTLAAAAPPTAEPPAGDARTAELPDPAAEPPDLAPPVRPGSTKAGKPKPGKPARTADSAVEPEPAPATKTARAANVDRERVEYERLAALEPRSPDAALKGYIDLAGGTSRWAGVALYAAARLAADRHDTHRAVALLEVYLTRFPDGPNAADARQLRARLKAAPP
jgi:hypothetical protein